MSWNDLASTEAGSNENPGYESGSDYGDLGGEAYVSQNTSTQNQPDGYEEDGDFVRVPKSDMVKFQEAAKQREALVRKSKTTTKLDSVLATALSDMGQSRANAKEKKQQQSKQMYDPAELDAKLNEMVERRLQEKLDPIVREQILPSYAPAFEYQIEKATKEFQTKFNSVFTGNAESDNQIMNTVYNLTADKLGQGEQLTAKKLEESFLIAYGDKIFNRMHEYEKKEAMRRKRYSTEESTANNKSKVEIATAADATREFNRRLAEMRGL
jgi:hypothetical protein